MKQVILRGPRDMVIEDVEMDTSNLGPHDIYVETEVTALKLGTDRGNWEGEPSMPGAPNEFPRWVGDSNLGQVRAVGSDVTRFKVGDRVVSRQHHQSGFVAPEWGDEHAAQIVRVPEGVAGEDAVYTHLYSLSGFCYRKAHFRPGEYVAVVGVGLLGLGAIALGPIYGAQVAAVANSPVRLEMAEKMGAHAGFLSDDPDLQAKLDEWSLGNGVDLVILTANPWPAYRTACEIVRRSGRISVVALSGRGEADLDFNPLWSGYFYDKGISLIAASGVTEDTYPSETDQRWSPERRGEHILGLMADGRLQPSKLITHRMHYTEIAQAYELMETRDKNMLGVVFDWTDVEG